MGAGGRVCGTAAGGICKGLERVWTQCWLLKGGEMGGASSRGTTKDKGLARGEGGLKTQGRLGWAEALEGWAQSGSLRGSWGKDRSWESLLLDWG